jgi:hypothetical protein
MGCRLTRGKKPELVIELGSINGNGLGVRRLASGWRRSEQIELRLYGRERGLQMIRKIFDSGADPLKLITKAV